MSAPTPTPDPVVVDVPIPAWSVALIVVVVALLLLCCCGVALLSQTGEAVGRWGQALSWFGKTKAPDLPKARAEYTYNFTGNAPPAALVAPPAGAGYAAAVPMIRARSVV